MSMVKNVMAREAGRPSLSLMVVTPSFIHCSFIAIWRLERAFRRTLAPKIAANCGCWRLIAPNSSLRARKSFFMGSPDGNSLSKTIASAYEIHPSRRLPLTMNIKLLLLPVFLIAALSVKRRPFGQRGDDSTAPRQYAADREFQVHHLALDVTPDFRHRSVSGSATITFPAQSPPRSINSS